MPLMTLQNVDYGVGGPLLLDGVELSIDAGERIALVGRNGAGKSTLLRLLAGHIQPDDGTIRRQSGLRVAMLAQEVPDAAEGDVFDVVAAGLEGIGRDLAEYHRLSHTVPVDTAALAVVQARIEAVHGWSLQQRVEQTLSRLGLDGELRFGELSGGFKRRALLARALVCAPDLLLLDEPTNHLDIESIQWLEGFLAAWSGALVFVTHDRRFLRALATRILDIDRGVLRSWSGDWDDYLRRRDERLHAQAQEDSRLDRMLVQEEAWIRQGIKARRTRDEGRVRRLEAMRRERAARRQAPGSVRMGLAGAEASGRKVIEARDLCFAWEGQPIVHGFSTTILRGDRIGLIGRNGSGKSTLIRLLLGELPPDSGSVEHGSNLQVAFFDQHRSALREDWNALDNVSEGLEYIEVGGRRKHVLGYLQEFLFTPERARAPITRLSGGERNRLLLARLFTRGFNLLVMDEPTNDLDLETLELLQELLADYAGTLLLVSHDREFLDNVVTSTLVMEGDGRVGEYVGGYSDWLRQRPATAEPVAVHGAAQPAETPAASAKPAPARRRLSYKHARELEQLPTRIEQLEHRLAELGKAFSDPDFHTREGAAVAAHASEMSAVQAELEAAYARWEALESEATG